MYQKIQNIAPPAAKCATFIKVVNMSTGALIIAFGLVGLIYMAIQNLFSLRFFLIFSPLFIMVFGALLLAIELKPQFMMENVGFLRTLLGRALLNFYVSTQVYYYFSCSGANNNVLAWVSSMVLFGLAVLYLILHFSVGRKYSEDLKTQLES